MPTDNDKWLAGLKVGDEVAISGRYGTLFATIEGETKLHWKVNGEKYRKEWGTRVSKGDWYHPSLVEPTPALKAEVKDAADRAQATYTIRHISLKDVPTGVLMSVAHLLTEAQPKKEEPSNGN